MPELISSSGAYQSLHSYVMSSCATTLSPICRELLCQAFCMTTADLCLIQPWPTSVTKYVPLEGSARTAATPSCTTGSSSSTFSVSLAIRVLKLAITSRSALLASLTVAAEDMIGCDQVIKAVGKSTFTGSKDSQAQLVPINEPFSTCLNARNGIGEHNNVTLSAAHRLSRTIYSLSRICYLHTAFALEGEGFLYETKALWSPCLA